MKTYAPKPRDIERRWYVVDANDVVLGRLASEVAAILKGKHKPIYAPHADTGDHVVVTWPGYQSLYEVARSAGAKVALHLLREDDGWSLDVDRVVRSLHDETRMVVVNAPHQPTGMLPTEEEWRRLASACSSRGIRLVGDEVYRFLEHDDVATLPAAADLDDRAVSIGVMSKTFAMAGDVISTGQRVAPFDKLVEIQLDLVHKLFDLQVGLVKMVFEAQSDLVKTTHRVLQPDIGSSLPATAPTTIDLRRSTEDHPVAATTTP